MNVLYPIIASFIVSLISVIFAIPFLLKKKISNHVLVFLLSTSVGVLLATVFMDFLPEAVSHGYTLGLSLYILFGFIVMFILEKFIHHHHNNKKCENDDVGHSHAYNVAPINIIGDAIHNFIDGLVIAGSFAVNIGLGISATISILFHEIPQEIADFGILLYAGMSKKKALFFNFLSALTSILGVIVGLFLLNKVVWFNEFIIPFAAGNFLYIAAANLVPQLHRHCSVKESIVHIFAIILGIGIITLLTLFGPVHGH